MQTGITKLKREILIQFHRRELQALEGETPSCNNCIKLTGAGICTHWKAAPPPEVKAEGCDEWLYDEIPF